MPYNRDYWEAFIFSVAEQTGRSPREIIYDEVLTREAVINGEK